MHTPTKIVVVRAIVAVVLVSAAAAPVPAQQVRVFSGEPRLLIVHGYSTSTHWWAFLQRKIDRYMDGSDKRVVEVQLCNKGGTAIARWMNVDSGERSEAWRTMLTPMIQAEQGKRPVVILGQQSLQRAYVYEDSKAGIRGPDDRERIVRGADIIEQYAQRLIEDGASAVVVGMHIYKPGMEPEIGNERLALAELIKRRTARIFAGPDTWTPSSKQHPLAFDTDKRHPNFIGAEMMAHYWFETLLEREGLDVPEWSREEMEMAIRDKPMGLTRDGELFQKRLEEWKITSRRPADPDRAKRAANAANNTISQRILQRYDQDGDGQLNAQEKAAFDKARADRAQKE